MDPQPILFLSLINWKISDLLTEYPQLVSVFLKNHAACIGCVFSAYCVLKDAVEYYHLDPARFMLDITSSIHSEN